VNGRPGTDASNPRSPNPFGQVIRWWYDKDWTDDVFHWNLFALAGNPENSEHHSSIIGDKYISPDTIYVAPSGRLWILTDISKETMNEGIYKEFGNCQMLCSDPATRETRRFLTGPNKCELTGAMVTPDEKTMFVGIQHPGETKTGYSDPANPKLMSSWPDGAAGGRPRSATIVITKDDGGVIGT
jgi:secreted PhoX family phosphatase